MGRRKKNDDTAMIAGLTRLGIVPDDIDKLRQVSRKLHTWHEMLCNGDRAIGDDGKIEHYNTRTGQLIRRGGKGCTDWGKVAQRQLDSVMVRYAELAAYVQGDPRGCPLYVYRRADLRGSDIDSVYPGTGFPVW